MNRFFNMDNPFFVFMGKVADLILLNIIWLICCIPIVTIGASTTALYYVVLKMVRNEESYIIRSFFKSFKENLKQSTIVWLIALVLGIVLFLDFQIMLGTQASFRQFFLVVMGFFGLLFVFILTYVFPLLAQFENTIKNTLKNALLMSIRHLPSTLLMSVLNCIPFVLALFLPVIFMVSLPLWIFAGVAVIAFLNGKLLRRIFAQYMPKEEADSEEEFLISEE